MSEEKNDKIKDAQPLEKEEAYVLWGDDDTSRTEAMKASAGKANPQLINEILKKKL